MPACSANALATIRMLIARRLVDSSTAAPRITAIPNRLIHLIVISPPLVDGCCCYLGRSRPLRDAGLRVSYTTGRSGGGVGVVVHAVRMRSMARRAAASLAA